jgi:hypothetical protein
MGDREMASKIRKKKRSRRQTEARHLEFLPVEVDWNEG